MRPPHPGAERYYREIARNKDVDARIKSAQDNFKWFPASLKQGILVADIFPDSPGRALRALLSMRYDADGITNVPYAEERLRRASKHAQR